MFGYVKIYKPELKIKDYEAYRAVYCSLCKELGKEYGIFARLFLSYDLTFYVIYRKAVLQSDCDSYKSGRCRFNPLKKCNYVSDDDEILNEAAALTIILAYYKIKDNIDDSRGAKRLLYKFAYPYIKRKYKSAKLKFSGIESIISDCMKRQSELESQKTASVDLAADSSAKALSAIFSFGIEDEQRRRISERFAYCLGRWVYLSDAYDDILKDIKTGNYNPFIIKYQIKNADFDEEPIIKTLNLSANEAAMAFNLLNLKHYKDILENIIYDGLENQQKIIQNKRGEQTVE